MVASRTTILTLRARWLANPPQAGELMASASGKTVYRVLGVTRLRIAGEPLRDRYRLVLDRCSKDAVPADATIHPWRWEVNAPGQGREEAPKGVLVATPPPPNHSNRLQPRPSARTRGVDQPTVADFGPGLRRRAVRDRQGRLLREADVELDDRATDPRNPNRRLRRAYRVDPVDLLKRAGTITVREVDAAAELRRQLERVSLPLGSGGSGFRGSMAWFLISPITDDHLRAARKVREASAVLGDRLWPPVLWICLGGSVRGYAAQWRIGTNTASDLVAGGMARLADHFYGRAA
jgi:hypothetical protein